MGRRSTGALSVVMAACIMAFPQPHHQAHNKEVVHQRGNLPVLEGHNVLKFPILLTERPKPGRHELGKLQIDGIGDVEVSIVTDSKGEVTQILTAWPKDVTPEHLSTTTHTVYKSSAGGGGIVKEGASKCVLMHASGQCAACSSFVWVEVIYDHPGAH